MRPALSRLRFLAACLGALVALPMPGHAQAVLIQSAPAQTAPAKVEAGAVVKVDDGALRYYAQQGQKDRVEAEIRHLQAMFPGYQPPADLYAVATGEGSPEDQPLWDLFGADKLDELKAGIAARVADDPGWQPPADLLAKIRLKETRRRLLDLSGDQQWKKLIQLAKETPEAIETADIELMWALAESFARAKQHPEALRLYSGILDKNEKKEERLATLQKSMAVLRMADVEKLYEMGRKGTDGVNEFDVILTDLTRARISAFLHDERKDDLNTDQVKAFADFARSVADPNQPGLVAWYHYKRREFAEALDWFKFSLEKGGDAKIAHGLAHSLRQLRKFREAEEVAFAWREYDVANKLLFVDLLEMDLTKEIPPYVEDERLARYGKLAADDASGEGAQAMAWYAYNSCQYFTALEWFQRANAWFPKEATAYGLALTYRRLGDRRNFIDTVNRYDGLFPKVVALVFPDDRYLPPTPCEETVPAPQLPRAFAPPTDRQMPGIGGFPPSSGIGLQQAGEMTLTGNGVEQAMPNPMTDPTIAYPVGMAPDYPGSVHDPLWRYSWGRVPSPTGQPFRMAAPNYHGEPWRPALFNPNDFPVMTDPQNPLRFAATGAPTADPAPATLVAAQVAPAGQFAPAREPLLPPWPLLARKVPGVLPMPYETNGFTLQFVNVPDARRKGVFTQVLRFVPPQGVGISFNTVWKVPAALPFGPPRPRFGMPGMPGMNVQSPFGQPVVPAPLPQPIVQFGPQSRLQPVSMQATGAIMRPTQAVAPGAGPQLSFVAQQMMAPVAQPVAQPAYAQAPNLLPPGYQPLVVPMPAPNGLAPQVVPYAPQAVPYNPYAPANPYAAPSAYAPSAYAPAPVYAPQPGQVDPAYYQPEPLAVPAAAPRRIAPARRIAMPRRDIRAVAAGRTEGGCGAGGSGAQAALNQGWCLLNAQRPQEAAQYFDRAIQAGSGKTREDAAYGKSLADLRSNLTDSAVQSANSASLSPERRNEIGVAVLAQRAQGFYNQGRYRDALAALDQRMAHAAETRDLSMMRGWSMFHLDRLTEAERLFSALDRQTSTKESRQGLGAVDERLSGRNR